MRSPPSALPLIPGPVPAAKAAVSGGRGYSSAEGSETHLGWVGRSSHGKEPKNITGIAGNW